MNRSKIVHQSLPAPTWHVSKIGEIAYSSSPQVLHVSLSENRSYLTAHPHLLSETERAQAECFVYEQDRLRFMAGRITVRLLYVQFLGIAPEQLVFAISPHGKPDFPFSDAPCRFNISHAEDAVLIGLHDQSVGIDTEMISEKFHYRPLLKSYFSNVEAQFITRAARPFQTFYTLWTRKEAFLKNMGLGLSLAAKQIPVLDGASDLPLDIQTSTPYFHTFSFAYGTNMVGSVCLTNPTTSSPFFHRLSLV